MIKEMKKMVMVMVAMLTLSSFAEEAKSVKDNPPKDGTPEKVVIDYIALCLVDKYEDATKLMDSKTKVRFSKSEYKYSKKDAKKFKSWDLKKKYTYKKGEVKESTVTIMIVSQSKDSAGSRGKEFKLTKSGDKWLITR